MNTLLPHLTLILCWAGGCAAGETVESRPNNWAQPVAGESLKNFYRVNEELYRSEQPTPAGPRGPASPRYPHRAVAAPLPPRFGCVYPGGDCVPAIQDGRRLGI